MKHECEKCGQLYFGERGSGLCLACDKAVAEAVARNEVAVLRAEIAELKRELSALRGLAATVCGENGGNLLQAAISDLAHAIDYPGYSYD